MEAMSRRLLLRFSVVAAWALLAAFALSLEAQDTDKRGRKYKAPPDAARVEVTVLRDSSGKPIENAAVVFHPMEGEHDKGGMELKTNEDGKTVIDVLPIGDTVRMQVIAKGFQTYGGDYKIDKPEMAVEIRLKRPGEQYSIYKAHTPGADQNAGQAKEKPAGSSGDKSSGSGAGSSSTSDKDDSGKDDSKDKPADSSDKQPPQSDQSKPQPN